MCIIVHVHKLFDCEELLMSLIIWSVKNNNMVHYQTSMTDLNVKKMPIPIKITFFFLVGLILCIIRSNCNKRTL